LTTPSYADIPAKLLWLLLIWLNAGAVIDIFSQQVLAPPATTQTGATFQRVIINARGNLTGWAGNFWCNSKPNERDSPMSATRVVTRVPDRMAE
jgi:hypothetical protein